DAASGQTSSFATRPAPCPRSGGATRRSGGRELEPERRAAADAGLDADRAAHPVHQLAADVEAEAGAPHAARELRIEPVELLEDLGLLVAWDARPVVAHLEPYGRSSRTRTHDHPRGAVPSAVLQRVLDQVDEHLPQL